MSAHPSRGLCRHRESHIRPQRSRLHATPRPPRHTPHEDRAPILGSPTYSPSGRVRMRDHAHLAAPLTRIVHPYGGPPTARVGVSACVTTLISAYLSRGSCPHRALHLRSQRGRVHTRDDRASLCACFTVIAPPSGVHLRPQGASACGTAPTLAYPSRGSCPVGGAPCGARSAQWGCAELGVGSACRRAHRGRRCSWFWAQGPREGCSELGGGSACGRAR